LFPDKGISQVNMEVKKRIICNIKFLLFDLSVIDPQKGCDSSPIKELTLNKMPIFELISSMLEK